MPTIQRLSPLTGKLTTYVPCYHLQTLAPATPVPTAGLITHMNSSFTSNGYDAFVDEVKYFETPFSLVAQTHVNIAQAQTAGMEGTLIADIVIAIAILIIAALIAYGVYTITSTAQFIIENFYPKTTFVQKQIGGTSTTVDTLAAYITCQRTNYPHGHVCPYCGQVFMSSQYGPPTDAATGTYPDDASAITAEQQHEATCPWKSGVPGTPASWTGIAIIAIGAIVAVVAIWAVAKVIRR